MNKLALITGASAGIGYELAAVFAKNGFDLVINSEDNRLNDKAIELRSLGVEVTAIVADLSTRAGAEELYGKIKSLGRTVDTVALNAGVGVGGEFTSTDFEKEFYIMNLNVVNTVYLAKKFLQEMVSRNDGRLLITSSVAGEMPGPYYAVYAASKAFLQSFTEALHYEMKDLKRNVTVTSLQPGATDTEFFERAGMLDTKAGQSDKADPAKVAQDGFDALMAGKDHVVSGLQNKIQVAGGKFMTEQMAAAAHGAQAKPNSLNQ
jgi:short-subunit dehydrogenase